MIGRVYEHPNAVPNQGDVTVPATTTTRWMNEGYTHFKYGRRIWVLTTRGLGERYYPNGKPGAPSKPEARHSKFNLRMTEEQREKLRRLGGVQWVLQQMEMQP